LNAEGDSVLRDDTAQGLGSSPTFLTILFGSIIRLAIPPKPRVPLYVDFDNSAELNQATDFVSANVPVSGAHITNQTRPIDVSDSQDAQVYSHTLSSPNSTIMSALQLQEADMLDAIAEVAEKNSSLTVLLIDPGYFAAGGIAGAVSRTATAPLDRLKVYLIANTGVGKDSLNAVKQGEAIAAVKHIGKPLLDACKELWRAGGIRSLFAGIIDHYAGMKHC
jgi:solute carrier family 25 phosphate transporter 23/24/25/41